MTQRIGFGLTDPLKLGFSRALKQRFVVPPFTVLDARQGYWQARKRMWLQLGIQGDLGRDIPVDSYGALGGPGTLRELYKGRTNASPSGSPRPAMRTKGGKTQRGDGKGQVLGKQSDSGASIFDPVLCELVYRWFVPPGGSCLDPFSGESTKGLVAAMLGVQYTGIEVRPEQVKTNQEQAKRLGITPTWICGDSRKLRKLVTADHDLIFTSPPYYDLEVYSADKSDTSTAQTYEQFMEWYGAIFKQAVSRLKDNRFLVVKIGDIRDKAGVYRNFLGDNIKLFLDLGLLYYNEAVLVTAVGSLPLRVGKQFNYRKLGKAHQNVICFYKGTPASLKDIPDVFGRFE